MRIPARTRYRKRVGAYGSADVKHDESVLPFSTAASCYNFDGSSGALRDGFGIGESLRVPTAASRFWTYRYYSFSENRYVTEYLFQMDGYLKKLSEDGYTPSHIASCTFEPLTAISYRLNGEDLMLLACKGRRLMTWNGIELYEHDSPAISSMALHYERLFVTSEEEPTKVFFSSNLDPTDWTASSERGGFIELLDERGFLNKVVSFANYLYIFRDHGISRVTAFGDQSEFAAVNLFVSSGRIYPESIAKCGTLIMFLASDGLYAFDGYECKRVLRNLDGLIGKAFAAEYFDGRYYLSCSMSFNDGAAVGCESVEHNGNALLVYDPASGEFSITRGVDISFLNACEVFGRDVLIACDGGMCGEITHDGKRFGETLPKHWRGPLTDLGSPDKTKALRELYITSATGLDVTVNTGQKSKRMTVPAGSRRVRFNTDFKRLSVAVDVTEPGSDVKPFTIIYSGA